ncbi:MAG: alcohol dehydrogenase catalytic domain-containing protein [Chloroflexi bacterium]|nr:alcohol dehydrogenase catalytic domain-containing protein [Chloroflexota bacterium]
MRGAVFYGKNDLRVEDMPLPQPVAGEVLIKIQVCGACHTDLAILEGAYPVRSLPITIGHEYAGTVVEVGEGVSSVRSGDNVTVLVAAGCGHCYLCRRGLEHLCPNPAPRRGGYMEYAAVPERQVYKLPQGVSALAGSMSEPVGVCLHAVERARLSPGDTVVVIGAGPIGLTVLQVARLAGAKTVILSEPNDYRRELGRKLGAALVVDPRREGLAAAVAEATEGVGADSVLETVGLVPTLEECPRLVRKGGTAVIVGVSAQEATARYNPFDLFYREVAIAGTIGVGQQMARAVSLLPELEMEGLFSHGFELADVRRAIEHRRGGEGLKSYVRLNGA